MTVITFRNHPQLMAHAIELTRSGFLETFDSARLEGYSRTGERHVLRTYSGQDMLLDARFLGLKADRIDDSRAPLDADTRARLLRTQG